LISNIPTPTDFYQAGERLLHMAWDQICNLLIGFEEIESLLEEDCDLEKERETYFLAAKQTIVSSYSIVQQAIEFFIKGRITEISPYLLLGGSLSLWPKQCDQIDRDFADFRTVDSQDLIKINNTVHPKKFTNQFKTWFEELRKNRNKIVHTVDKTLNFSPLELLLDILRAHEEFIGEFAFCKSHFDYLESTPEYSVKYTQDDKSHSYIMRHLHEELRVAIKLLPPSEVYRFFGFFKKKYAYWCPSCRNIIDNLDFYEPDYDHDDLRPYQQTNLESRSFRCFICDFSGVTLNQKCDNECCKNNLIDNEFHRCLECGYNVTS
jgi:hypothetical protein